MFMYLQNINILVIPSRHIQRTAHWMMMYMYEKYNMNDFILLYTQLCKFGKNVSSHFSPSVKYDVFGMLN